MNWTTEEQQFDYRQRQETFCPSNRAGRQRGSYTLL